METNVKSNNDPELNEEFLKKVGEFKRYDMQCVPLNSEGLVYSSPLYLSVIAKSSAEATRKGVKFMQELFPTSNVKSIEVVSFVCSAHYLIVGVENDK